MSYFCKKNLILEKIFLWKDNRQQTTDNRLYLYQDALKIYL